MIVGTGNPVVVTANVPGAPMGKVVAAALVIAGAPVTVRVKLCVAGVGPPLSAVNVSAYVPPVPAAGVPASVAVPSPLSVKVTSAGSAPVDVIAGAGLPTVVTVNVPGAPAMNVVVTALVKRNPPDPSPTDPTETPLPVSGAKKLARMLS